jgi:3-hydroxyisobutyrate dehydrogenase
MTDPILFIGLGAMGTPMSRNLGAAGHPVVLCDLREQHAQALAAERGVAWVPLAQAGTVPARTVILMLPDSPAVESVVSGLLTSLPAGALIIDMSSSLPTSTVALAQRAAEHGLAFIDAPVSGGVARAVTGELTIMVGADEAEFERALPILASMGTEITRVGPVGAGHAMKALNNLLSAIGLVGASEVLAIGAKFGLDPKVMLDVLNASTGGNHATRVKMERFVLSRAFDSGFALSLMVKDLRTALELARATQTPSPMSTLCLDQWTAAHRALGDDADHTHIAHYVERRAGIELRPGPPAPAAVPHQVPADSKSEDAEMTSQDEVQEYIDSMARSRGYVLNYHKIMAKHDYETLKAANQLVHAAYLKERTLDRRTKELIFITSLTVMRATKSHIQSHIKVALDLGVTPMEILEAIEIALPEAGVVAFQHGFDAWAEVVGADGIEPRVEAFNASAG